MYYTTCAYNNDCRFSALDSWDPLNTLRSIGAFKLLQYRVCLNASHRRVVTVHTSKVKTKTHNYLHTIENVMIHNGHILQ